jgi:hypothetical protein
MLLFLPARARISAADERRRREPASSRSRALAAEGGLDVTPRDPGPRLRRQALAGALRTALMLEALDRVEQEGAEHRELAGGSRAAALRHRRRRQNVGE